MKRIVACAGATVLLGVLATGALAQSSSPLADKLPGQSLLYLGWGGAGPNSTALTRTGLAQLLNDPEVQPHIQSMVTQFEAFVRKQAEKEMPAGTYDPIRSLLVDVVWDRPWALALIDVKLPDPKAADAGPPTVEAALIVDLGDRADAAMGHVNTLLDKFLPADVKQNIKDVQVKDAALKSLTVDPQAPAVLWGLYKKHLVVAVNQAAAEKVVALVGGQGGAALAANPQFVKAIGKVGPGLCTAYADVARFRKELLPVILQMAVRDAGQIAQVNKLIEALGLDAIDAVGMSCRPDGADFLRQCYLLAPRGKPGLLVLADQKPLATDLLAAVPADATFAILANCNRVKVIEELEKQLAKFPDVQAEFNKVRKSIEDAVGLNLKTDLAEAVGDGLAIYNSPSAGGFLFTGLTVVAEVKNHDKLKAAMPKLQDALKAQLKAAGGADMLEKVSFKSGTFKKHEYQYVVTTGLPMPFAPAWCLTEKYLVFSLFPQTLKTALLQLEAGREGSLLTNDWLGQRLAGCRGASLVAYVNNRQLMRIAYPAALPLWQVVCSMAGKEGIKLDVNALPRLDLLTRHVGDSFGAMVPDGEGVLFTARGTTPLAGLMGLGSALPALALKAYASSDVAMASEVVVEEAVIPAARLDPGATPAPGTVPMIPVPGR